MMTAATFLLAHLDDPPDWVLWARPATPVDQARGADVVVELDVGPAEGVARVAFAVRWRGEERPRDVACWMVVEPWRQNHFVAWLKDIRRDLRRRFARHGTTYTRDHVHVLDPREATHARR